MDGKEMLPQLIITLEGGCVTSVVSTTGETLTWGVIDYDADTGNNEDVVEVPEMVMEFAYSEGWAEKNARLHPEVAKALIGYLERELNRSDNPEDPSYRFVKGDSA